MKARVFNKNMVHVSQTVKLERETSNCDASLYSLRPIHNLTEEKEI